MASSRQRFFHIVIEEYDKLNDKHLTEQDINKYFLDSDIYRFYAFIQHDSDVNDSGDNERKHYHCSMVTCNEFAKNTILKDIASKLEINVNCISSRQVKDFVLSTQYLIHKNNKEKAQYNELDVWTNDTNELFKILFDSISSYELDINYLIKLVKSCNSIADVYRELGMKNARTYRSIIIDLWKDMTNYL